MWNYWLKVWAAKDLRRKVLITFGLFLVFRVLANIPVPLTPEQHQRFLTLFSSGGDKSLGQFLGLLDTFSGGSLQFFSIVSLGVYPYITASIVMSLLVPIIPALGQLQQEGESGRRRITRITHLLTVPLAFLEAFGHAAIFAQKQVLESNDISLIGPHWLTAWSLLLTLTAGTMILVWLGELITEYGIGNGISLLIFVGILSALPATGKSAFLSISSGSSSTIVNNAIVLLLGIIIILATVYLYLGQRRVTIHYPTKRKIGKESFIDSSSTTYIPLQVNSAGMIPLIFANSLVLFPSLLARYLSTSSLPWLATFAQWSTTYITNPQSWPYWLSYFLLVIGFTYMYAHMQWQQQHVIEHLQKQGATVQGLRPGSSTEHYFTGLLNRLTLGGALSLGIIALLPMITQLLGSQLLDAAKILIVVGVALDTLRQLESHLAMRNYAGFLP